MHRRWSLILMLVLAAPPAVLAQGEAGFKGGVSFGDVSNKELLPGNLDTRTGFAAGVYANYYGGPLGIGLELLYAQRGARSDQAAATSPIKLDFVDVPLYLKVRVPAPGFSPFVYAGPQISFRTRCRTANGAECAVADSTLPTIDYDGVVGAGIRFRGFAIEGRYVYGLKNLLSTVTSGASYHTRSFLILASIGKS